MYAYVTIDIDKLEVSILKNKILNSLEIHRTSASPKTIRTDQSH